MVNLDNGTVKKCFDSAFKFSAEGNQAAIERMGKVVALVQDDKSILSLVSYSEGDAVLQVIDKIGHESDE